MNTPVAPNLEVVKRRIDDYLWRDRSAPLVKLREFFRREFMQFDDVAIVGGLVRDFARKGKVGFKSDIDIVINAPRVEVEKLAKHLDAVPNRFGGYGYQHPLWKIDFWALETTWAVRQGFTKVQSTADVTSCVFFTWDSAIYDLKHRKVVAGDEYLEKIRSKTLDICLLPNPSIEGNLLRAIRRILFWDLKVGPALSSFIMNHLDEGSLRRMKIVEFSIYNSSALQPYKSIEALTLDLLDWEGRRARDPSVERQLELPLME